MKQEPIILRGVVLGRAVARSPLTAQGHPMEASHDEDVSLTLRIPIPGERPLEFSMRLDSVPRGWMEIGDAVTVTVDTAKDTEANTEPYSVETTA